MPELEEMIVAGRFADARSITAGQSATEVRDSLISLGYDSRSVGCYAFAAWMASQSPSAESHLLASDVLTGPLCHLPDAYAVALHHVREAAALSPQDLEIQEQLLFFSTIPDRLVDAAEAKAIAEGILERDPGRESALRALGRL